MGTTRRPSRTTRFWSRFVTVQRSSSRSVPRKSSERPEKQSPGPVSGALTVTVVYSTEYAPRSSVARTWSR
ncbi:Uncharacterised protein [Mycobacteroides abscessus]|nr:Uncharacterised protein [Mycobacteroides abscessus]